MLSQHAPEEKAARPAKPDALAAEVSKDAAPPGVAGLQQTVGNRAVQRLLQAKLVVGPANDAYEHEADQVAGQVMQMPAAVQRAGVEEEAPVQAKPLAATISRLVQRASPEEEMPAQGKRLQRAEEEEPLQGKRLQRAEEEEPLQGKRLQRAEEEEPLQGKRLQRAEEEEPLQGKRLQRAEEEEPLQGKPLVQRRGDGSFEAGPAVEERLAARAGGGAPLPESTRTFMEDRFGADFSGVRVHHDGEAAQLSQAVGAQAFTHGGDVYFNSGKYDPGSSDGQHLLAHELTHTVQQGAAPVARRPADKDQT
ncbi:MAG: DUF4157 domain-containing protein [Anaerolineales bacterium]|nr:DUF4157 domain-containing protein [Anaerolineales bacterium]